MSDEYPSYRTKNTNFILNSLQNMVSKFHFQQCIILLFAIFYLSEFNLAQNSINLEGSGQKWVNIGDVDVTGNQITVEAFVRRQNNMNIVSKHDGTDDCNYLLRPNSFQISTSEDLSLIHI